MLIRTTFLICLGIMLALLTGVCQGEQTVKWGGKKQLAPVTLPVGGTVTLTWNAGTKDKMRGVTQACPCCPALICGGPQDHAQCSLPSAHGRRHHVAAYTFSVRRLQPSSISLCSSVVWCVCEMRYKDWLLHLQAHLLAAVHVRLAVQPSPRGLLSWSGTCSVTDSW